MSCNDFIFEEETIKKLRQRLGFDDSALIVGSSGFIRRQKGYDDLIRAVKILREQNLNAKALILAPKHFTGWDFEDRLFEIIEEEGMEDYTMVLRGYNKKEDAMAMFSCSDIIVYPYTNEAMAGAGCSASIKDALSLKRPILVSECSSFTDMGREVYKMEDQSPRGIARSIQWILSNETIKNSLIKKASEKSEENSLANIAKKHLELFGL